MALVLALSAAHLGAQEPSFVAQNPLAELKDHVTRVLAEAHFPFTPEQEAAITLMMEDRRRASEELFGNLMDFRSGPTQGQEADRLKSAIEWLRNEFLTRLQQYLTPEQAAEWARSENPGGLLDTAGERAEPAPSQTQFVRIENNPFTSQDNIYRFGQRGGGARAPEVIQRGGSGAYHGNAQLLMKDESLNAGRRFAANKPPYQERQISFDISGPVIPGRLTTIFAFSQNRAENVDTIRATLPDRVFALGITRPVVSRSVAARNVYQLAEGHSLSLNAGYKTESSENQGVGGFVMPDRASSSNKRDWNLEVSQFSSLSARSLYETRFNFISAHNKTTPATEGLRINVLDAFSSGGAQNRAENTGRTYEFSNLYTRFGETLTLKTGVQGAYGQNSSLSENNFTGTFTFSSLAAFLQGRALNFRVNRGNPAMDTGQLELAFFVQNDLRVTPKFTLMFGSRYEIQTNVRDPNNLDGRVGIAYAVGRAAVIRAGAGIFHHRIAIGTMEAQRRLDGIRQYEIIVDNPLYSDDPLQSGTIRNTFPSLRVTDPDLATPYSAVALVSYERTFFRNLFFSAAYDFNREIRRLRVRDMNAPRDTTSPVPRSCRPEQTSQTCLRPQPERGNILNLESTAFESANNIRMSLRQRFSIFSVTANYAMVFTWADFPNNPNLGTGNIASGFSTEGLGSDPHDLRTDWSLTPMSRHSLNTTVNAQLPLGVFLAGTMATASGRGYTVVTGRDDNRDTAVNDRPPGVGRNSQIGPASLNFNFNISKAFFFGQARNVNSGTRTNVNVFANMTNAFNRPNYNPPSGVMTSPTFGRYTSAGDPREIEVGLRFQF